jgi:tetratricopeptide (TPR) repeat protein
MTKSLTPNARPPSRRPPGIRSRLSCLAVTAAMSVAPALAATSDIDDFKCGVLNPPGQYGPYDYRTATRDQKHIVEMAHFSHENELLIRGTSTPKPGPDLDYTLRAFPNHARALKSMVDLRFRDKDNPPYGMRYTAECWFNRAIRFAPDDGQVRMVYGIFLLRNGEKADAVQQLEIARASGLASANFQYNLGLAYFQVGDYEKARSQAYKAKELGFELEGLKNMLTRVGQWREAPPAAPEQPEGAAPKAEDSNAHQTAAPKN